MATTERKKASVRSRLWRAIKRAARFDVLNLLPFTSEVWRARRGNERTQRSYRRALAKLGPMATGAQREEVFSDWQYDLDETEDDEQNAITRGLLHRARSLLVPVPSRDGGESGLPYWEEGQFGTKHLSRVGIARIRAAIREEEKARREARAHWVIWVSALTGLVGAATGLLAIILRSRGAP